MSALRLGANVWFPPFPDVRPAACGLALIVDFDWTMIAPRWLNSLLGKHDAMGKEKNKGGKEARKPKKVVPKTIAANPSTKGAATSK